MIKAYRQLIRLSTFEERYNYLKIGGTVGQATFGFERYLNQNFYLSPEWQLIRRDIIVRDGGCDLAIDDREIFVRPTVHHIVPITIEDIEFGRDIVFDPDNLVLCSHDTHLAIHYARDSLIQLLPIERSKGDMCPWLVPN